jgi:hypothetical protein
MCMRGDVCVLCVHFHFRFHHNYYHRHYHDHHHKDNDDDYNDDDVVIIIIIIITKHHYKIIIIIIIIIIFTQTNLLQRQCHSYAQTYTQTHMHAHIQGARDDFKAVVKQCMEDINMNRGLYRYIHARTHTVGKRQL